MEPRLFGNVKAPVFCAPLFGRSHRLVWVCRARALVYVCRYASFKEIVGLAVNAACVTTTAAANAQRKHSTVAIEYVYGLGGACVLLLVLASVVGLRGWARGRAVAGAYAANDEDALLN